MQNAQGCLLEIETLSSETSSQKRREVLRRVTDLFFLTCDQQTPGDLATFGTVMERIAYELEVEARAELSQRIADAGKAPHHLVCRLAIDEIAVARPVLERSGVLSERDLVQIAKARGQDHLRAIARRTDLPAPVTDVIVERGESPVLVEVTRNVQAEYSRAGFDLLAQKARADGNLLAALDTRTDLPPDLMHDIKRRVARRLKSELAGKSDAAGLKNVDDLIDESAAGLDLESVKKSNDALRQRAQANKLTEDDIVELAKANRLTETVHALSVLTGLDDRMVSHCLLKADIAALGIVCKALEFQSTTFLRLAQKRAGKYGLAARDVARAMREYHALNTENAKRTLCFLRLRCNVSDTDEIAPDFSQTDLWRAHDNVDALSRAS